MIVLIGGMVGFIVIAMYLPLFKVYDQVQAREFDRRSARRGRAA